MDKNFYRNWVTLFSFILLDWRKRSVCVNLKYVRSMIGIFNFLSDVGVAMKYELL